jgi:iron complex transport system permease protein
MKSTINADRSRADEEEEVISFIFEDSSVTKTENKTYGSTKTKEKLTVHIEDDALKQANNRYILRGKYWIIFWIIVVLIVFQLFFGIFGMRIPYFISLLGDKPVKALHTSNILNTEIQRQGEITWWRGYLSGIPGLLAVGAALAIAGASFQSLFKNPLASPDILGVTAGGTLGGGIYILATVGAAGTGVLENKGLQLGPFNLPWGMFQIVMFLSGLATVGLVVLIATKIDRKFRSVTALMLTGMAISAVCNSLLSCIKTALMPTEDADNRSSLLNVLMYGQLGSSASKLIIISLIIFTPILIFFSFRLNAMTFGEEEAKGMGIHTNFIRMGVIICSTFLVISVVSTVGQISWIGMVAPFIGRMLVGPDNKKLLPFSMVLGSLLVAVFGEAHSFHVPLISFFSGTSSVTFFSIVLFFIFLVWSRRRGGSVWM